MSGKKGIEQKLQSMSCSMQQLEGETFFFPFEERHTSALPEGDGWEEYFPFWHPIFSQTYSIPNKNVTYKTGPL